MLAHGRFHMCRCLIQTILLDGLESSDLVHPELDLVPQVEVYQFVDQHLFTISQINSSSKDLYCANQFLNS